MNHGGVFNTTPDWSWDTAHYSWTDFDLWFVYDGNGILDTPSGRFYLHGSDCFILRGYERYIGTNHPHSPLKVLAIHFDFYDTDGQVVRPETLNIPFHRNIRDITFFRKLMEHAIYEFRNHTTNNANKWLQVAILEILQCGDKSDKTEDGSILLRIEQLCKNIQSNPGKEWNVNQIASSFHYSTDHFSRIFKHHIGISPRHFITKSRIDEAKTMLLLSDYPLKRICSTLGYCDVQFFSRQFKKWVGITPKMFRYGW